MSHHSDACRPARWRSPRDPRLIQVRYERAAEDHGGLALTSWEPAASDGTDYCRLWLDPTAPPWQTPEPGSIWESRVVGVDDTVMDRGQDDLTRGVLVRPVRRIGDVPRVVAEPTPPLPREE